MTVHYYVRVICGVKVENTILLQGPLSRNRRISALRSGDTLNALILERIDRNTAVLNLYGNKLTAFFENGVPRDSSLKLMILLRDNARIVFRCVDTDTKTLAKNPLVEHLGIAPKFLRAWLDSASLSLYELLRDHNTEADNGKPQFDDAHEIARQMIKVADHEGSLPPENAAFMRNFAYLLVEDGEDSVLSAAFVKDDLFYAAFELGANALELSARQHSGGTVGAVLLCDRGPLYSALSGGLSDFCASLQHKGFTLSVSLFTREDLKQTLRDELDILAGKNIVDYTA